MQLADVPEIQTYLSK